MAKPKNLNDVIAIVRQSRLISDQQLKAFVAMLRQEGIEHLTTDGLFDRLIADNLLTPFQAKQLKVGRWRGLIIGKYRLQNRIGSGGMGQVFLAEHEALKRTVAVKVLVAKLADDRVARARLIREAQAAAALDHPNIVRVFDIDIEQDPPYLVMEFIDGVSLQAAVAKKGTFHLEAAALCGRQVALGLEHAANFGLVHRDIKPANLLLDRQGMVKILDLGLVRLGEDNGLTTDSCGESAFLGTVDYLSPEQARNSSKVDCRADIYSLGSTIYFLLAGHPPYNEGAATLRLVQKQSFDPVPIHQLRPDVPIEFSVILQRMMARHPEQRFQKPKEVAAALNRWAVPIEGFPEQVFVSGEYLTKRLCPSMKGPESNHINKTQTQLNTSIRQWEQVRDYANTHLGVITHMTPVPEVGDQATIVHQDLALFGSSIEMPAYVHIPIAFPDRSAETLDTSSMVRVHNQPKAPHYRAWLYWSTGAAMLMIASAIIVWLVIRPSGASSDSLPGERSNAAEKVEELRLVVKKNPQPGEFRSIQSAVEFLNQDAVIEVHADEWTEVLDFAGSGLPHQLTLRGVPQTRSHTYWRLLEGHRMMPMIRSSAATVLRLEGFYFDGEGLLKNGLAIGKSTHLNLKDCQMTGFLDSALLFQKSSEELKHIIEQCRFWIQHPEEKLTNVVTVLEANPQSTITLKNCRFEGLYNALCCLEDRISKVSIVNSRICKASSVIDINQKSLDCVQELHVERNCIVDVESFIRFQECPTVDQWNFSIFGNYIERMSKGIVCQQRIPQEISSAWSPIAIGLIADGNFSPGDIPLSSDLFIPKSLLSCNPANDELFLRINLALYPSDSILKNFGVHMNRKPVHGADQK